MKRVALLTLAMIALAVASPRAEQAPSVVGAGFSRLEGNNVLWYRKPAPQWDHAMPLGNGRLAAMISGNANAERIQLTVNSLWMGQPRDTNNTEAHHYLPEVRRLLFAGQPVEAYTVAEKHLTGRPFRLE